MKVVLTNSFSELGLALLKDLVKRGHEVLAIDESDEPIKLDKVNYYYKKVLYRDFSKEIPLLKDYDAIILFDKYFLFNNLSDEEDEYYKCYYDYSNYKLFKKTILVTSIYSKEYTNKYNDYERKLEEEIRHNSSNYIIHHRALFFHELKNTIDYYINTIGNTLVSDTKSHINPISHFDLAEFIAKTLRDEKKIYDVGGKEIYSFNDLLLLYLESQKEPYNSKFLTINEIVKVYNKMFNSSFSTEETYKLLVYILFFNPIYEDTTGQHSFKKYLREEYRKEN